MSSERNKDREAQTRRGSRWPGVAVVGGLSSSGWHQYRSTDLPSYRGSDHLIQSNNVCVKKNSCRTSEECVVCGLRIILFFVLECQRLTGT